MKKSLIALAALAATASFAQSSVTLSGNLDFAAGNVSGNAKGTTIATTNVVSTTSVINIIAVEDLGGGMKATAKYGIDPRNAANDNAAVNGAASASNAGGMSNTWNRDELFVGIEGGFGNLRLGSPNSIGLTTFLSASPLGTGVGSGFGAAAADYSNVRYDRSARYDSPNFNGFSVSALYAPGNDQPAATSTSVAPNNGKITELGLSYVNGPLSIGFVNISQGAYSATAADAANQVVKAGAPKTSVNILAASYKLGNTTLSAGWNEGDAKQTSATLGRNAIATAKDTKGYRVGLRQDIGAIALIASYAEQKTATTYNDTPKETVTGLRADYNLSKTAAVYLGYERYDTGRAYATYDATSADTKAVTGAASGVRTIVSAGIRKSF